MFFCYTSADVIKIKMQNVEKERTKICGGGTALEPQTETTNSHLPCVPELQRVSNMLR